MLVLSKDKSTAIKGIVIMMMLFCHLFNRAHIDLCTSLLYIGDRPLALWIKSACTPVAFFMALSGYGLAVKYETGKMGIGYQLRRILRLYLYYWVVLAVFLTIGHYMKPTLYPGNITTLLQNVLAWNVTYNTEMWFLLPYSVLSLFSFHIIRCIDKIGHLLALGITLALNLATSFMISRYGPFLFSHQYIYQPMLCFHLLVAFTIGVTLRRTSFNLNWNWPQWLVYSALALLFIIACATHFSIKFFFYVPLLTILLAKVHRPAWIMPILIELGRKSMPIWMIHTWLAYYLFQPQVYSLKYVPFIFLGLLIASYLISIPVMWIAERINRSLSFNKKQSAR